MTIIQLVSDTHSGPFLIDSTADFVIHSGDITNYGFKKKSSMPWDNSLISMKNSIRPIYWVPGNHDIGFKHNTKLEGDTINALEKTVYFNDISIKGISMSVCYNAPRIADVWDHMTAVRREEEKYFSLFLNEYADIIISHSPPTGDIGSEIECGDIGSPCLREYIEEFQPRLVVCGHVHKPLVREMYIGDTLVLNVSRISRTINFEDEIKKG